MQKKKSAELITPISEELKKISDILDRTIRPALQADGGDLDLVAYDGPTLSFRYQGACGGCPSALTGTLMAIRHILQQEYSPNIQLRPV